VVTLRERVDVGAGPKPAMIAVSSLFGLVVLAIALASSSAGFARIAQFALTLVIPAVLMVVFWRLARDRVSEYEAEAAARVGLEQLATGHLSGFVAAIVHELTPHPEPCNLRAEALAVADEYQALGSRIEVAVSDTVVIADPMYLHQMLHVLVDNAVRHGGTRVAIWAAPDAGQVRLTVSDDGPGLREGLDGHVFERFVDLGGGTPTAPSASGLAIARALSDATGGAIAYKRDPNWTHFSFRLPLEAPTQGPSNDRMSLSAGVG
jgi:signal transduction histidine kinase